MERKQVFYINEIRFVCDTVANICKNNEIECYTLEDVKDFAYLINDLKAQIVIIDVKTLSKDVDCFWNEIKSAELLPKILITGQGSEKVASNSKEKFDFVYDQNIDIITFGQTLKSHLE
jgi:DNA-binding NtrC family response regulator